MWNRWLRPVPRPPRPPNPLLAMLGFIPPDEVYRRDPFTMLHRDLMRTGMAKWKLALQTPDRLKQVWVRYVPGPDQRETIAAWADSEMPDELAVACTAGTEPCGWTGPAHETLAHSVDNTNPDNWPPPVGLCPRCRGWAILAEDVPIRAGDRRALRFER